MPVRQQQCLLCKEGTLSLYSDTQWEMLGSRYNIAVCSYCGSACTAPLPDNKTLEKLYATSFNYRWYQDHLWAKLKDCSQRIEEYAQFTGKRVLDYGGGIGYFSQVAREKGYESITYDPYAGKNEIKKERWDTVVCLHVLEHSNNPDEVIIRIKSLLAEGGRLILAVPNFSGEGYRKLGMDWVWAQPPLFHIFHFTSAGLIKLLEHHGFKDIRISYHERWDANLESDLKKFKRFRRLDGNWHRRPFRFFPLCRKMIAYRNSLLRFKALKKASINVSPNDDKLSELQIICSLSYWIK